MPASRCAGSTGSPLERGLGSSSAAAVAGAAIAQAWVGRQGSIDPDHPVSGALLFDVATELEGHPDNAAAAVYGGFTVVAGRTARRLDPHPVARAGRVRARSSVGHVRRSRRPVSDRAARGRGLQRRTGGVDRHRVHAGPGAADRGPARPAARGRAGSPDARVWRTCSANSERDRFRRVFREQDRPCSRSNAKGGRPEIPRTAGEPSNRACGERRRGPRRGMTQRTQRPVPTASVSGRRPLDQRDQLG